MACSKPSSSFASYSAFLGKRDSRTFAGRSPQSGRITGEVSRDFRLRSTTCAEGSLALLHHETVIAVAEPSGDFLLFPGLYSATDKRYLCEYTPANVGQDDGVWYVYYMSAWERRRVPFISGMRVDARGIPADETGARALDTSGARRRWREVARA